MSETGLCVPLGGCAFLESPSSGGFVTERGITNWHGADAVFGLYVCFTRPVRFRASLKLIQTYAPHMLSQRWGRIVTVGSVQQRKPHKDMLIYAASKAAQENMARNLAKQFAPFGVTVNNIAPGVIDTPRNEAALSDEAYRDAVLRGIPSSFIGQPEDCCGQILLLCSDEGRYITGENIFIDGGMQL